MSSIVEENKEIVINNASLKDLQGIKKLLDEGDYYHHLLHPDIFSGINNSRTDETLEKDINLSNYAYFIAKKDCEILGLIIIKILDTPNITNLIPIKYASIENIIITKNFRNRGIGKRLFEFGLDWINEKGVDDIRLSVFANNSDAIRFYEKMGFTPSSIRYRYKRNKI